MTNESRSCCTKHLMSPLNSMIFSSSFHTRSHFSGPMTAERLLRTQTHESDSAATGLFLFAVTVPELALCVLEPSYPLIMCRWQYHHLRLRLTALNAFNTKSFHSLLTNNHFVQTNVDASKQGADPGPAPPRALESHQFCQFLLI